MAFDLPGAKEGDYFSNAATNIVAQCKEDGLFLRPLGGTLYFAPPLCIKDHESKNCLEILSNALSEI